MRQPPRPDDADNPLRLCYTGPSPDRERQLEIEARFGFEIVCGYALSESPYGLIWPHGTRPYGTLGAARQHPELGHVNDARVVVEGRTARPGEVGGLELRNPAIMRGYYEMPEETAEVLVDGWLRTGDLVTDNGDGTYTFVGREKQVIRRRGENLSPAEVEAVLERHPDVAEAAVVGVPSELSEEDIKAFVIPAPGRNVDVAELHRFASERLARFKVPRYFEVVRGTAAHADRATRQTSAFPGPHDKEVDMERHQESSPPAAGVTEPADFVHTWIGSSTADQITIAGRDLAEDLMGRLTLDGVGLSAHHPSRADAGRAQDARRRARLARGSWPHPERARRPADFHGRAGSHPGCGGRRSARGGQRDARAGR